MRRRQLSRRRAIPVKEPASGKTFSAKCWTPVSCKGTFNHVSSPRRGRGSLDDPKQVTFVFEAPARKKFKDLVAATGVSRSELAQWLVDSVKTDEHGRPLGWTSTHDRQELPDT